MRSATGSSPPSNIRCWAPGMNTSIIQCDSTFTANTSDPRNFAMFVRQWLAQSNVTFAELDVRRQQQPERHAQHAQHHLSCVVVPTLSHQCRHQVHERRTTPGGTSTAATTWCHQLQRLRGRQYGTRPSSWAPPPRSSSTTVTSTAPTTTSPSSTNGAPPASSMTGCTAQDYNNTTIRRAGRLAASSPATTSGTTAATPTSATLPATQLTVRPG